MSFLTPDEIQRFKEITLKVKGITLTDSEAEDQGTRLIKCFELLNQADSLQGNLVSGNVMLNNG
jgi:hypothetical protein